MGERAARSLLLAPFDAGERPVAEAVWKGLEAAGVEVIRFDDIPQGAPWTLAITAALRAADFVVVDLSRPDSNVLYELGHAHAWRRPTILLVDSATNTPLPSDLTGSMYVVYDADDLSSLTDRVRKMASWYVDRASAA